MVGLRTVRNTIKYFSGLFIRIMCRYALPQEAQPMVPATGTMKVSGMADNWEGEFLALPMERAVGTE